MVTNGTSEVPEFHASVGKPNYAEAMKGNPPHLILTIETTDPIEVGDFVGAFTSLASQYEKYISLSFPDRDGKAEVFVAEVTQGSIIAVLVEWGGYLLGAAGGAVILDDFVARLGSRISQYKKSGGRDLEASKSDLRDFHNALAAIAHDPNGSVRLEAAVFEDGERKIRAAFKFTTQEARQAEAEIERHRQETDTMTNGPALPAMRDLSRKADPRGIVFLMFRNASHQLARNELAGCGETFANQPAAVNRACDVWR